MFQRQLFDKNEDRASRSASPAPSYRTTDNQEKRSFSPAPSYHTTDPRRYSNRTASHKGFKSNLPNVTEDSFPGETRGGFFSDLAHSLRSRLPYFGPYKDLLAAGRANDYPKVEALLSAGILITASPTSGGYARSLQYGPDDVLRKLLHSAVERGNEPMVSLLLTHGANVNGRSAEDFDALYVAIMTRHGQVIPLLLAHGADVNSRNGSTKMTPLMVAAQTGQLRVVKLLLRRNAEASAQDTKGYTALMYAKQHSHRDVIKALLASSEGSAADLERVALDLQEKNSNGLGPKASLPVHSKLSIRNAGVKQHHTMIESAMARGKASRKERRLMRWYGVSEPREPPGRSRVLRAQTLTDAIEKDIKS